MNHLVNTTILNLDRSQIHPRLREHIPAIAALAEVGRLMEWDAEAMAQYIAAHLPVWRALKWLNSCSQYPGVFCIPYYSPEFCKTLMLELMDKDFARNEQEETEYQIEELVLGHEVPGMYETCEALFAVAMQPVIELMYQQSDCRPTSIQAAKYNPVEVSHGNWHFDRDSDYTVVVSLNPDEFVGGGTEIRVDPLHVIEIPPLPAGHALLFRGRTTLHRGLYVSEGERMLLVHWTVTDGHQEYREEETCTLH